MGFTSLGELCHNPPMDFQTTLRRLTRAFPDKCSNPTDATVFLMGSSGTWQGGQWFPSSLLSLGDLVEEESPAEMARQFIAGQVPPEAPFLEFPSDIQPDWALGLVNFQEWLMGRLYETHGLPAIEESTSWPRAARRLCQKLGDAHASLMDLADVADPVYAEERLAPWISPQA